MCIPHQTAIYCTHLSGFAGETKLRSKSVGSLINQAGSKDIQLGRFLNSNQLALHVDRQLAIVDVSDLDQPQVQPLPGKPSQRRHLEASLQCFKPKLMEKTQL